MDALTNYFGSLTAEHRMLLGAAAFFIVLVGFVMITALSVSVWRALLVCIAIAAVITAVAILWPIDPAGLSAARP